MKELLEYLGYPVPFLISGLLYEWWWENPCIRRLRRGRKDKLFSVILMVGIGFVAWTLYQVLILLWPGSVSLVTDILTRRNLGSVGTMAEKLYEMLLGALLLLPIHLWSMKWKCCSNAETSNGESPSDKKSAPTVQTVVDSVGTLIINNYYLVTDKGGKVNLGRPDADGSLEVESVSAKAGSWAQLYASVLYGSDRQEISVSGTAKLPDAPAEDYIGMISGSGTYQGPTAFPYQLDLGIKDENIQMWVGPEAGQLGFVRFRVSSAAGALERIVRKRLEDETSDNSGGLQ